MWRRSGQLLAAAEYAAGAQITLWDVENHRSVRILDQWRGQVTFSPDGALLVTKEFGESAGDAPQDSLRGKRAIDATVGAFCRVIPLEETVTIVKHFSDPFDQTKIGAIGMPSNDNVTHPGRRPPICSWIDQDLVTWFEKGGH